MIVIHLAAWRDGQASAPALQMPCFGYETAHAVPLPDALGAWDTPFHDVHEAYRLEDGIIGDVALCNADDQPVCIIEVRATHAVPPAKAQRLTAAAIPWVEVDGCHAPCMAGAERMAAAVHLCGMHARVVGCSCSGCRARAPLGSCPARWSALGVTPPPSSSHGPASRHPCRLLRRTFPFRRCALSMLRIPVPHGGCNHAWHVARISSGIIGFSRSLRPSVPSAHPLCLPPPPLPTLPLHGCAICCALLGGGASSNDEAVEQKSPRRRSASTKVVIQLGLSIRLLLCEAECPRLGADTLKTEME